MKWIRMMLLVLPAVAGSAWAHGGGLNKDGCHNDRGNGGYHCHRSGGAAAEKRALPRDGFAPAADTEPYRSRSGRAFANCNEARAAPAAPVRRSDPGYGPHLDRDNDGIGCEPYRGR